MLILDTDHVSALNRRDAVAQGLGRRLLASGTPVATTAVTVEEVMRGWLAKIAATRSGANQVRYYDRFQADVQSLGRGSIIPFDAAAAERYEQLRALKLGVGTMDLKIAAIVLVTAGAGCCRGT